MLCSTCLQILATAQKSYTISGYITDGSTGEALIGANVYINTLNAGTITNTYGFYSLTVPEGEQVLESSYIGYTTMTTTIRLQTDTTLSLTLSGAVALDVVEITAESLSRIAERTQMSTVEVPIQQIKNIPALLGETDVLKALQLLPSVQSGGEGQSGLYVRGGSPDPNLILLDGVPVYNANQLFGFFSVFNADAITGRQADQGRITCSVWREAELRAGDQYEGRQQEGLWWQCLRRTGIKQADTRGANR